MQNAVDNMATHALIELFGTRFPPLLMASSNKLAKRRYYLSACSLIKCVQCSVRSSRSWLPPTDEIAATFSVVFIILFAAATFYIKLTWICYVNIS
jgi:hypothetical protein